MDKQDEATQVCKDQFSIFFMAFSNKERIFPRSKLAKICREPVMPLFRHHYLMIACSNIFFFKKT